MPSCWEPVWTPPPVPITLALENLSRPESTESDVASMTASRVTSWARMSRGSTCTVRFCRRSPQIATLATPRTRSRRALIVQ